jgi:hypothetical protein
MGTSGKESTGKETVFISRRVCHGEIIERNRSCKLQVVPDLLPPDYRSGGSY